MQEHMQSACVSQTANLNIAIFIPNINSLHVCQMVFQISHQQYVILETYHNKRWIIQFQTAQSKQTKKLNLCVSPPHLERASSFTNQFPRQRRPW